MSTLQNWKTKLAYIGFGSFFGCLCTIIGMLASPVTAQRDKFDTIQCSRLEVVDAKGKVKVSLSRRGVLVYGNGWINTWLGAHEDRGFVNVYGGDNGKLGVGLSAYDDGGRVNVYGRKDRMTYVQIEADESGGIVYVSSKDSLIGVGLGADDHGGRVYVSGNADSKGRAMIGINKYGNGAVSTWDKNGYRQ